MRNCRLLPFQQINRKLITNKNTMYTIRVLEHSVVFCWPFRGGTSVVVPQCYMLLCVRVYGLLWYGHLYYSCSLCFVFSSTL